MKLHVSGLRFCFVKTLKRPYMLEDLPFPKVPRQLPAILTTDEVTRLIDGARNLTDRTMLHERRGHVPAAVPPCASSNG